MRTITKKEYDELVLGLAKRLEEAGHWTVYGIPKNGSIIVESLEKYGFYISTTPEKAEAIIDDLIDSGRTRDKYSKYQKPFFTLVEKTDEWIHFWFEKEVETDAEELLVRELQIIGEDAKREGLQDTPRRVVKMWREIFRGYDKTQKPSITTFNNGADGLVYDQMIIDEGNYYSQCEHHMVPFFGNYWFAYIPHPKGKILGLSKVARIVDYHSAKLQVQERLVNDIVNDLWDAINHSKYPPVAMGLVMRGRHLCKEMRGARKQGLMTTIELRGVFKNDINARQEFLKFVNTRE